MKKVITFALVASLLVLPFAGLAAEMRSGESLSVAAGEKINNDLYAAGGNVNFAGEVSQDLTAAGGNVSVGGRITQDLMVAGGTINISANVGDDVRVAGGNVTITGTIGDDLVSATGQLNLTGNTTVNGDALITGGSIIIDGDVAGKTTIAGGDVVINGTLNGNVEIYGDRIRLGEKALIKGNLTYHSGRELKMDAGAKVNGETKFVKYERGQSMNKGFFGAIAGFWILGMILSSLLTILVLVLVFPKSSKLLAERSVTGFWKEALRGFIILVVTPFAMIFLFITLVGWPLGLIAMFSYGALLTVACFLTPLVMGVWLFKVIGKKHTIEINWKVVVVGVLVAVLLTFIPFVGWVVKFLFMMATMGAIAKIDYEKNVG